MRKREIYSWRCASLVALQFIFVGVLFIFFYWNSSLELMFRSLEVADELRSQFMILLLVMLYPLTSVIRYVCLSVNFCCIFYDCISNAKLINILILFLGPCWWHFNKWSLTCDRWVKHDRREQDCESLCLFCSLVWTLPFFYFL